MSQPISKQLIKEFRGNPDIKFTRHKLLGYIAEYFPPSGYEEDNKRFAYRMTSDGDLLWVTERTIKLRMKTGHAIIQAFKQRKKPILPDSAFSLEELELAASIMEDIIQTGS